MNNEFLLCNLAEIDIEGGAGCAQYHCSERDSLLMVLSALAGMEYSHTNLVVTSVNIAELGGSWLSSPSVCINLIGGVGGGHPIPPCMDQSCIAYMKVMYVEIVAKYDCMNCQF